MPWQYMNPSMGTIYGDEDLCGIYGSNFVINLITFPILISLIKSIMAAANFMSDDYNVSVAARARVYVFVCM